MFWTKNLTLTSNDQNKLLKCPWQFISKLRILDLMISTVPFGLGNIEVYGFPS